MVPRIPRWVERPARNLKLARVGATEALWPVLRHLPGDSRRFGPPRRITQSLPQWAEGRPDIEVETIDQGGDWDLPPPVPPSSPTPTFFSAGRGHRLFDTWVARVPGGRVVGPHPMVVGPDDTLFADLSNWWPTTVGYQDLLLRLRLPRLERVSGSVAVVGAYLSNNYYHWLVDIVPRLRLLGDRLRTVDHVVVPASQPFQRDCLAAAGVPMDRVIEPHRALHLIADELIVPSLVPRASAVTVDYLQGLFRGHRSESLPARRLYATRSNMWRRRVANEDELVAALSPLGFESVVMDGLPVAEQARLFSEAEAVVGPNGSALANIVFIQPGSVLVELWDSNYVHPGDWELAVLAGGHYHLFISESPKARTQWRDIEAPVDDVLAALAAHGIS